ncbi:hypothetical protein T265_00781 [Opisthorchis viverrini]|uniref:Uncharacterized protein n=1 Tax=Opisthorchis viverrini TaxID=6198 RepID=A0A075A4S6_OPIVI|nr:hypothetical protein T265_00781 [Opisthorchis viverrini]KER33277.1 hypothetical protein T265_00781 [Opisthorchis viverrini]
MKTVTVERNAGAKSCEKGRPSVDGTKYDTTDTPDATNRLIPSCPPRNTCLVTNSLTQSNTINASDTSTFKNASHLSVEAMPRKHEI